MDSDQQLVPESEIDLYSRAEGEINIDSMIRMVGQGSLLVLSGDIKNEHSLKLIQMVEAKDNVIIAEDGLNVFQLKCCQNSDKIVYWIEACAHKFILKALYTNTFCIRRNFCDKILVNFKELIKEGKHEVIHIRNVDDRKLLVSALKLSDDINDRINYDITLVLGESCNDPQHADSNVHHLRMEMTEYNESQLVWESSSKSVEHLLPFVTLCQSLDERELCHIDQRVVIIAGEPGIGKSTYLRSVSRQIEPEKFKIMIDLNNVKAAINNLPTTLDLTSVVEFISVNMKNEDEKQLFQLCLEAKSSRQVILLIDSFDVIGLDEQESQKKVINLIKFLINNTSAKIIVTTRMLHKKLLEMELMQFACEFQTIDRKDWYDFLLKFWSAHLEIMLPEFGLKTKDVFQQHVKELFETEWVFREKLDSVIGLPLQMTLIAEVYLKYFVRFLETSVSETLPDIKTSLDLYEVFIALYFNQKNILKLDFFNEMFSILNLDSIFTKSLAKLNTDFDSELLMELEKYRLLHLHKEGSFQLNHDTVTEYLCAKLMILWIQGDIKNDSLSIGEFFLNKILLQKEYAIVRGFINDYIIKYGLTYDARKRVLQPLSKYNNNVEKFRGDSNQTALHIAAIENRMGIYDLFVNTTNVGIVQESSYIYFLSARDDDRKTGIVMDRKYNPEMFDKTIQFLESCPNFNRKILMSLYLKSQIGVLFNYKKTECYAYLEDQIRYTDNYRRKLYHSIDSQELKLILENVEEINKKADKFYNIMSENRFRGKFIAEFDSYNEYEQYYIPLIVSTCYSNTPINIAAGKGFLDIVQRFGNEDVLMSRDMMGRTPLHCASEGTYIRNGNDQMQVIKFLVSKGLDINSRNKYGNTPLCLAANGKCVKVFKYLVELGADLTISNNSGDTPLLRAAQANSLDIVRFLVEHAVYPDSKKVDLNCSNFVGNTALHHAVDRKHSNMTQYLVKKGADVNCCNLKGTTPLLSASERGHLQTMEFLVKNGADVNYKNINGLTPLLSVCLYLTNKSNCVMKFLLDNGADPNCVDHEGNTPLKYYCSWSNASECILLRLLKGVTDINAKGSGGSTALMAASHAGLLDIANILLENKADVHIKDNSGCTALIIAARHGHKNIVDFLLADGADLHARDNNGCDALFSACTYRSEESIHFLIEKGVDIYTRNNDGCTALLCAVKAGNGKDVIDKLLGDGRDVNIPDNEGFTPLKWALRWGGQIDVLNMLLDKGADLYVRDIEGSTPLISAARHGVENSLNVLLEKNVDLEIKDNDGYTALIYAALGGFRDVVKILLEHGADINARGNDGYTPMIAAARWGKLDVVELLIKMGAKTDVQDVNGRTAIMWAMIERRRRLVCVVKALLECNANVNLKCNEGRTALIWAVCTRHKELLNLIVEKGADLNVQDNYGRTALIWASSEGKTDFFEKDDDKDRYTYWTFTYDEGYIDLVNILVERGVDVNICDRNGRSALIWASSRWSNSDIVNVLLKYKADIKLKDDVGKTALDYSIDRGHRDIFKALKSAEDILSNKIN